MAKITGILKSKSRKLHLQGASQKKGSGGVHVAFNHFVFTKQDTQDNPLLSAVLSKRSVALMTKVSLKMQSLKDYTDIIMRI